LHPTQTNLDDLTADFHPTQANESGDSLAASASQLKQKSQRGGSIACLCFSDLVALILPYLDECVVIIFPLL
jgi:hypothetical protein